MLVNMHQAKTNLSKLVRRSLSSTGSTIIFVADKAANLD